MIGRGRGWILVPWGDAEEHKQPRCSLGEVRKSSDAPCSGETEAGLPLAFSKTGRICRANWSLLTVVAYISVIVTSAFACALSAIFSAVLWISSFTAFFPVRRTCESCPSCPRFQEQR